MTRETLRDARRSAILAAVIRALARDGVAESTTRTLAASAEVNQATLRYYFGSKDDLLLAVLQELMRNTREVVLGVITPGALAEQADIRQVIADGMTAFWTYVEKQPELQMIQLELTLYTQRRAESAWLAREQYAGYVSVIETILRESFSLLGRTSATPFEQIARFLVAGFDGLTLQYLSDHDNARARRDLHTLIVAVIALVGAQPPPLHSGEEGRR
ncbi:MAG TPA: TetR/AcrR family transcriptional regulator [Ktedonobacterales bacterium]|nr:TetR/AcrR family transcriptional regulator [Ktedonobacterales bacterium]